MLKHLTFTSHGINVHLFVHLLRKIIFRAVVFSCHKQFFCRFAESNQIFVCKRDSIAREMVLFLAEALSVVHAETMLYHVLPQHKNVDLIRKLGEHFCRKKFKFAIQMQTEQKIFRIISSFFV